MLKLLFMANFKAVQIQEMLSTGMWFFYNDESYFCITFGPIVFAHIAKLKRMYDEIVQFVNFDFSDIMFVIRWFFNNFFLSHITYLF